MKKYAFFVGVDISKRSLDICLLSADKPKENQYYAIANTPKAITSFIKSLPATDVLFCMEDTGIYGMPLCQVLENTGLDYAVVPAIEIKRSKGLHRGKSDKADAKDIARYAITHQHEIKLFRFPEPDLQELRLLIAEREKLIKTIKLFEATNENFEFIDKKLCTSLKKNNRKTVLQLRNQLAEVERLIKGLTERNEKMNEQMKLLQTIPGIGPQTALLLMSYTRCFTAFDNWRQLACYAGIAPFPYQSGSSIKGKTKVSHYAQKRLKSAIHMASLTTKKFDVEIKQYYERKVADGKNKMLVINAVRCKLIARAFAVINRGTPFVNTQKFAT